MPWAQISHFKCLLALPPTCLEHCNRAIVECERHWCGNTGNKMSEGPILVSNRELVTTRLDICTLGASHLTADQHTKSVSFLKDAYVALSLKHKHFLTEEKNRG